jgi:hypothetical protein
MWDSVVLSKRTSLCWIAQESGSRWSKRFIASHDVVVIVNNCLYCCVASPYNWLWVKKEAPYNLAGNIKQNTNEPSQKYKRYITPTKPSRTNPKRWKHNMNDNYKISQSHYNN